MKRVILLIGLVLLILLSFFVYAWATEFSPIKIHKGWNLIYGFSDPEQLDGQALSKSSIKAVYAFIPTIQEYARVFPNPEYDKMGMMDEDEKLFQTAFWVYSEKEADTEYWLYYLPTPINEKKLYKGWNFVGMLPDMAGKSLKDVKGSCIIERAYGWDYDSTSKGYWNYLMDEKLPSEAIGMGFVVKVANDCRFGDSGNVDSGVIPPPSLPLETDFPEGQTSICEDSDGYDLYTVGKTSYGSGSEANRGKEDYCDFYAKGAESRIGLLREGYCDGKTYKEDLVKCGNGYVCRSGKCIQGDSSLSMCSETDGGKDEFKAGKTVGIGGQGEDDCAFNNANGVGLTDECSGEGCSVYEYYCNGEERAIEIIPCSNGCKNRVCLK